MDNKIKEKDMKVSELAVLMRDAFQSSQDFIIKHIDEKIDGLDKKLTGIMDGKFEEVNYKLNKIDKKLDSQEKIIFNHDQRLDKLEVDNKKIKNALAI